MGQTGFNSLFIRLFCAFLILKIFLESMHIFIQCICLELACTSLSCLKHAETVNSISQLHVYTLQTSQVHPITRYMHS